MVPSFSKGHLVANNGTSPGCDDVFATRPKVKAILWGLFWTKPAFGHVIEGEEG
jgi:hypothetical protein